MQELHLLKTDLFMELVESGRMPLRQGVSRLVGGCFLGVLTRVLVQLWCGRMPLRQGVLVGCLSFATYTGRTWSV